VWASTEAARYLHGRFVWAHWDVNELAQKKNHLAENINLLSPGISGIESTTMEEAIQQLDAIAGHN
jgi:hypothetical protein